MINNNIFVVHRSEGARTTSERADGQSMNWTNVRYRNLRIC
jgi:hypothetical protein